MSLMISWGDGTGDVDTSGRIFLDAVTLYTQAHTGKVTSHPIASGSNISDHFIKDNSKYNVSAVITAVDVSSMGSTTLIADPDGLVPFNVGLPPSEVSINSTDNSVLKRLIPSSIGQFFSDTKPTVVVDGAREDQLEQIRSMLVNLMSGVIYNEKTSQFDPNIQIVTLYEFDGILLRKPVYNLVMTNMVFREDQNTGYGLYCTFTFEQVTFALLKKTTIPKDVANPIKKKSASKATKGNQDGTPDVGTPPKDVDPLRQARENG